MNVLWYYSVRGNVSPGLSWAQLREAARKGEFSRDDYVWTPGYGKEWRKAADIEQLFPVPNPLSGEKASTPVDEALNELEKEREAAAETFSDYLEEYEKSHPRTPPLGTSAGEQSARKPEDAHPAAQPEADGARHAAFRKPVGAGIPAALRRQLLLPSPFADAGKRRSEPEPPRVFASLSRAWANTLTLLFRNFSIGRWLIYAGAVFFILLGQSPLFLPVLSTTESAAYIRKFQLETIAESQLFTEIRTIAQNPSALMEQVQNNPQSILQKALPLLQDFGARCYEWFAGMNLTRAGLLLGLALALLVAAYLASWFLSRGWTLLLMRIYRQSEPLPVSYMLSQPAAAVLQRGLFWLYLLFQMIRAALFGLAVWYLGTLPEGATLSLTAFQTWIVVVQTFELIRLFLFAWVRDFATPRLMLLGLGFREALRKSLRHLGFWFVGYTILLFFLFTMVMQIIHLLPRAIVEWPLLLALFLPPLYLLRTLFALDIIFRQQPELQFRTPISPLTFETGPDNAARRPE